MNQTPPLECWECGTPLTPHTAHPLAGRDYCSGCAAALKREYAAEERRGRRGIDNHRGDEE